MLVGLVLGKSSGTLGFRVSGSFKARSNARKEIASRETQYGVYMGLKEALSSVLVPGPLPVRPVLHASRKHPVHDVLQSCVDGHRVLES